MAKVTFTITSFPHSPSAKALLMAGVLLLCCHAVAAQQTFGYVLELRGDWYLNGSTKLSKGSSVTAGSSISTTSPADESAYIVVADRSGRVFGRRDCGKHQCNGNMKLPASAGGSTSLTSRLVGAVMALISDDPGKYVSLISRGEADPVDGVVKLAASGVSLQDIFRPMPGGKYLLRFDSVAKGTAPVTRDVESFTFDWNPERPAPLIVKGVRPSLYRLSLLEVNGKRPTGQEAWVLLVTPQNFAHAQSSYNSVLDLTKSWGKQIEPTSTREFLRAALESIASQTSQ